MSGRVRSRLLHWIGGGAAASLLVLVLGSAAPAGAAELLLRIGNLDVPAGTVVHGDAIAVGGTLDVEGTVEGNATALGGGVIVGGLVEGSARAEGGNVILRSTAVVGGTATARGGRVSVAPGASIGRGTPAPGTPPVPPPQGIPGPVVPIPSPGPQPFPGPYYYWWVPPAMFGAMAALKLLVGLALLLSLASFIGLAWATGALFPGVTTHLAAVLERSPLAAFGVGLLGWALLGPLVLGLVMSVIGLALVAVIPIALLVALEFGITAVALLVGRRIRPSGVGLEVLVGAVVLTIVFAVPHLGWLLVFLASTLGFGTVLLALVERGRVRHAPPPAPPASAPGT